MTLVTAIAVTAVVWSISLLRSTRLRALVYSLPIPITIVLVTTGIRVDGQQVVGIALLNVFLLVVAFLHNRLGWHIILADLAGIAAYVVLGSAFVAAEVPLEFLPSLAVILPIWLAAVVAVAIAQRRRGAPRPEPVRPPPGRLEHGVTPALVKLAMVFAGSLVTVGLAQALNGLVVTFPYSGILVVIEVRRELPDFNRYFLRNSVTLLSFLTGTYLWAHYGPTDLAVLAGWGAFAVAAAIVQAPRLLRSRVAIRYRRRLRAYLRLRRIRRAAAESVAPDQDRSIDLPGERQPGDDVASA